MGKERLLAVLVAGLLVGLVFVNLPYGTRVETLCQHLSVNVEPPGSNRGAQTVAVTAWYNESLGHISYSYGNPAGGQYVWNSSGSDCSGALVFLYLPFRGSVSLLLILCVALVIASYKATAGWKH